MDGALSPPGAAGPQRFPEGQLSKCAGSTSLSQSVINQWGWGFQTVRGSIDPRITVLLFSSLDVWSCRFVGVILTRGWEFILHGAGGRGRFPEVQLPPCGLYKLQAISNQRVRVGFPLRTEQYRPGESFYVPALKLSLYGRLLDPGKRLYLPLAPLIPGATAQLSAISR